MKISHALNQLSNECYLIKAFVEKKCGKNIYGKIILSSIIIAGVGLTAAAIALVAVGVFAGFPLLFTAALILFSVAVSCIAAAPVAYALQHRGFFALHDM